MVGRDIKRIPCEQWATFLLVKHPVNGFIVSVLENCCRKDQTKFDPEVAMIAAEALQGKKKEGKREPGGGSARMLSHAINPHGDITGVEPVAVT
jgi:hypothetical protein